MAARLVLPLLFLQASVASAQSANGNTPPKGNGAVPSATTPTFTLADCLAQALERHPRIAAQRASLAGAEDGLRALEALRLIGIIDPEIAVRRHQASLGVAAAAAGVDQAQHETTYAVSRTYVTVLYAREQERTARSVVDRLSAVYNAAKTQLDAGGNITSAEVDRSLVYLRLAEAKRIQATVGVRRAMEALREAIGLGCELSFAVPDGKLPDLTARPGLDDMVNLALARRAELIRANIFVEVTCLEVDAQDKCLGKRMETFAAGGDIHAVLIPQGVQNSEYRPAGIPPEMPIMLAGSRSERMKRAQSYNLRARAVAEETRNLIVLEAEDAYLRWDEASQQVVATRQAGKVADKLAEDTNKNFTGTTKVKVEDVINTRVLAAQTQAQYNEYLYKQILTLLDLQRITAGGFCAGLVEAIGAQQQAPTEKLPAPKNPK